MKRIEFNLRDTVAFINSSSLTTMGLWMSTVPFLKVDWSKLTVQGKFEVLEKAFEGSKKDLPMPSMPDEYSKFILAAFGLKNWKVFYTVGKHCSITLDIDRNEYCFAPLIYLQENKSLYGVDGIEYLAASASPEEVISVLETLLEKLPKLEEEYYAKDQKKDER